MVCKVSGQSEKCRDGLKNSDSFFLWYWYCCFTYFCGKFYNVVVNALYVESFCVENPAVRKLFAFSDFGRVVNKEVYILVFVNINWPVEIIS